MWYGVRRHIVSSGVPCQVSVCYGTGTSSTMHAMVLNCTYICNSLMGNYALWFELALYRNVVNVRGGIYALCSVDNCVSFCIFVYLCL